MQGFPPFCPTCEDAGHLLIGDPPFGDHNPPVVRVCPDCPPVAEFAVEVGRGANVRRWGPMAEPEARRSCRQTQEAGMDAALLVRDGDGWDEVERFPAASPLLRSLVRARPYSHWSR